MLKDDLEKINKMLGNPERPNPYQFTLRHGRAFDAAPLPANLKRQASKMCYKNAFQLAANSGLRYCEGFAIACGTPPIPFAHAWCIDDEGQVIDTTWKSPEHCQYFGIEFNKEWLIDFVLSKGTYGVIDDIGTKFKLVRGDIPPSEFLAKQGVGCD